MSGGILRLTLLTALWLSTTCNAKHRAIATRISTDDQRIGGPKALGQVGDYLLENDKIRIIIHGPGTNRANTVFAGSVIDADLQRPNGSRERGHDQLQELLPAFVFEVIEPTSFEVTRDGSETEEAVISIKGIGGDALQSLALVNTGLLFPQNLEFQVDYILRPGNSYVEIETTITNASAAAHPFPFLDPPDIRDLGLDIPGLEDLTLSTPFGHLVVVGAEQKPFMPGQLGFDAKFGIPKLLEDAPGFPAFPGAVTDFLSSTGDGVSYALTVPAGPNNYVNIYRDRYAEAQPVTDHSVLAPFFFAGTIGLYHTHPPERLLPGERFSYTSYFAIGRGDVASVAESVYEIHDIATGTFSGYLLDSVTLEAVSDASLVVQDIGGGYVSQFKTDKDGQFFGPLPPGDYTYRVVTGDRPTTASEALRIAVGETTSIVIPAPPNARLAVSVTDANGRRIPCKLTVVGRYDAADQNRDPRDFLYNLALGETIRPTRFDRSDNDYIEHTAYSATGHFDETIRPGDYEIVVSRGLEYDIHREPISLRAGRFVERQVSIARAVDTDGYVAIDTHLHAIGSPDSSMDLDARVVSVAGEGVEFAVATDHNAITDYAQAIARSGLSDWLVSAVGVEVTTFEMGHFNGFPLKHDSASVRGGDIEWAGFAPGEIFEQLRQAGLRGPENTLVQVNHPRWESLGYFNQYNFDQEIGDVIGKSGLSAVLSPFSDEFSLSRFSWDFDALEIISGKRQDLVHNYRIPDVLPEPPLPPPEEIPAAGEVLRHENGAVAYPGSLQDWFALLNQGRRYIGLSASDSHSRSDEAGFPRSYVYVGEGKDTPGTFNDKDIVDAIRSGRVISTTGPMIELFVNDSPMGSDVRAANGTVAIKIIAQVPNWMEMDRAIVYANGEIALDIPIDPGAKQVELDQSLTLEEDSWLLLEVTGPSNLFPVVGPNEFRSPTIEEIIGALASSLDLSALSPFGNLQPPESQFVYPQAISNPIWIEVDGNGRFDPPHEIPTSSPHPPQQTSSFDLRSAFERIPESYR